MSAGIGSNLLEKNGQNKETQMTKITKRGQELISFLIEKKKSSHAY